MELIHFHLTTLVVIILKIESLDCTLFDENAFKENVFFAYENQILDTQETYEGEDCGPANKEMNISQKAEFYNKNLITLLQEETNYRDPGENVLKYIINYNQQLRKITKLREMDKNLGLQALKDIVRIGKPTFLNVSVSEKRLSLKFKWNIHDLSVLSYLKNQTIDLWETCLSYIEQ